MSTADRKARKRAGIPFQHPAKEGTPFEERSWFTALIPGKNGKWRPRSLKARNKALADRGLETVEQ